MGGILLSMRNGPQSLEPKLPDDLVMAIGRVAVLGTRLEADVTVHLWTMSGLNPNPSPARKRVDTFSEVMKRLRQYTRENFRGQAMTDVLAWLHQAQSLQKTRHLIVHGIWSARPGPSNKHAVRALRNPERAEAFSAYDVHELADSIQRVRADSRIVSHWFRIQRPEAMTTIRAVTPEEMARIVQQEDAPGIA